MTDQEIPARYANALQFAAHMIAVEQMNHPGREHRFYRPILNRLPPVGVTMLNWLTHAGQAAAAGYVPLPSQIQQLALTTLQQITGPTGAQLLS